MIYPSSGGTVYDTEREPPYAETSPLKPIGRFGATKMKIEQLLLRPGNRDRGDADQQRVRTGSAHRHRAGRHRALARVSGGDEPIRVFGAPETTRDFIYIDDVCDAIQRVISSDDPPSVVNIGSGIPTTLGEVAELVSDTVGGIEIAHEPARGFDVGRTWLDIRLAKERLGWEPSVSFATGSDARGSTRDSTARWCEALLRATRDTSSSSLSQWVEVGPARVHTQAECEGRSPPSVLRLSSLPQRRRSPTSC